MSVLSNSLRALALALAALPQAVAAQSPAPLPAPTEQVVLTVSGAIAVTNAGDTAQFDRPMLAALGLETFSANTPWNDGAQEFTGVPLHRLMERLGVTEGTLRVQAINDYATTLPMSDATPGHALMAMMRNGAEMSVRDKGPLWIVYPFDADAKFRTEEYYSRSIWQLDRIEVQR